MSVPRYLREVPPAPDGTLSEAIEAGDSEAIHRWADHAQSLHAAIARYHRAEDDLVNWRTTMQTRNDRIRSAHAAGLQPWQIHNLMGITRFTIYRVLARHRHSPRTERTGAPPAQKIYP